MYTLRTRSLTASADRWITRARGPETAEPRWASRSTMVAVGRPSGPAVKLRVLRWRCRRVDAQRGDAVPAPLAPPKTAEPGFSQLITSIRPPSQPVKDWGPAPTTDCHVWDEGGTDELLGQPAGDAAGDVIPVSDGGHPRELSGADGFRRVSITTSRK